MALRSTCDNVSGIVTYNKQDLSNGIENVPVIIDCKGIGKAELPNFQVICPSICFQFKSVRWLVQDMLK